MKKLAKTLNKIFTDKAFMEDMSKNCRSVHQMQSVMGQILTYYISTRDTKTYSYEELCGLAYHNMEPKNMKRKEKTPAKAWSFTVDGNSMLNFGEDGIVGYLKQYGIKFSKFITFILDNPKLVDMIIDYIPMNDDYRTKVWLKENNCEEGITFSKRNIDENQELSKLLENIKNMENK